MRMYKLGAVLVLLSFLASAAAPAETIPLPYFDPIKVEVGEKIELDAADVFGLKASEFREMVWRWGDGSLSRGIRASHVYQAPGVYYLRASFVDLSGETRERVTSVEVLSSREAGLSLTANYECGLVGAHQIRGDSVWVEVDGSNEFNFRIDNVPQDHPIYVHILGFSKGSGRMADWRWTIYPDVTTFSKRAGNFRVFIRSAVSEPWEKFLDESRFTIRDDEDENSFALHGRFESDHIYLSHTWSYGPGDRDIYLQRIETDPRITIDSIGETAEGRPIKRVRVIDPESPLPPAKRFGVWFFSTTHPNEMPNSVTIEAMIDGLLDPANADLLARTAWNFIPIFNVDGAVRCGSSYNARQINLSQYPGGHDRTENEPEIVAMQAAIKDWFARGNRIDILNDMHTVAPSGTNIWFPIFPTEELAGPELKARYTDFGDNYLRKIFQFPWYGIESNRHSGAVGWMIDNFPDKKTLGMVVEIGQAEVLNGAEKVWISDETLRIIGRDWLRVIDNYSKDQLKAE
ncbi:M14 family zinc carboxypeptidase [candidate division KSB1 bacterium]